MSFSANAFSNSSKLLRILFLEKNCYLVWSEKGTGLAQMMIRIICLCILQNIQNFCANIVIFPYRHIHLGITLYFLQ